MTFIAKSDVALATILQLVMLVLSVSKFLLHVLFLSIPDNAES